MSIFSIHLVGQPQPLTVELPFKDQDEFVRAASVAKFISGHLSETDGDGIYLPLIVATSRIVCALQLE